MADSWVWRNRQKSKAFRLLWAAGPVLAGLMVLVAYWQSWFWFAPSLLELTDPFPGAATGPAADMVLNTTAARDLEARMLGLLDSPQGLITWHQLAGRTGKPPAIQSGQLQADDQVRYGQYLLEQERRQDFQRWWQVFCAVWQKPDGTFHGVLPSAQEDSDPALAFWQVNLPVARLLLQSCSLWPDPERQADLIRLSDHLLRVLDAGMPTDTTALVPASDPILDPGATPTPRPSVSPTPSPDQLTQLRVLRLSSVDLHAMQALIQVDQAWQGHYDTFVQVIQASMISSVLPLPAWAWQPGSGYVPFPGDVPVMDTRSALQALLYLCESGQMPEAGINWIREQLYNKQAVYASYHLAQGTPTSSQECLPAYAMIARIARLAGDQDLYQAAVSRLNWHVATSSRSMARMAVFRQDQDGLVSVWALDNTWALLAFS